MKLFTLFILIVSLLCGCTCAVQNEEIPTTNVIEEAPLPEKSVVTVSCTGDVTLAADIHFSGNGSFYEMAEQQEGDLKYFFRNVADIFGSDDLTIINFEGTLSERGYRCDKQFAFRGKPEYVNILTGVEAATLANNHARDYGPEAFDDTVTILEEAGIAAFSGTDIEIIEKNGIRIGLIGIYALNSARQQELEPAMETAILMGADLIIVNFHWGEERAAVPNLNQRQLAHKAIDMGADLVIGHHPHVIQGIEKYNGKYIAYSLGNFCFGGNKNPSDKDAYIFRQTFTFDDNKIPADDDNIEIIPCSVSSEKERNNYQPTPLEGDEKQRVLQKITERSESIPK